MVVEPMVVEHWQMQGNAKSKRCLEDRAEADCLEACALPHGNQHFISWVRRHQWAWAMISKKQYNHL